MKKILLAVTLLFIVSAGYSNSSFKKPHSRHKYHGHLSHRVRHHHYSHNNATPYKVSDKLVGRLIGVTIGLVVPGVVSLITHQPYKPSIYNAYYVY